eukprot:scaffold11289_cov125-Ochromonas_danica.AAC.1
MIYSICRNARVAHAKRILSFVQDVLPHLYELAEMFKKAMRKKKRTEPIFNRDRKNALTKMLSLPDWMFKRMFRVDRPTFYYHGRTNKKPK